MKILKKTLKVKYLSSLVEDLKQDTTLIASQYRFYKKDTIRTSRIIKERN